MVKRLWPVAPPDGKGGLRGGVSMNGSLEEGGGCSGTEKKVDTIGVKAVTHVVP